MKYAVLLREVNEKTVLIEADSKEEAIDKGYEAYRDCSILLDETCDSELEVSISEYANADGGVEDESLYEVVK